MPLIRTQDLKVGLQYEGQRQIYCGLDTMLTTEIAEALHEILETRTVGNSNTVANIYGFERALQGPILEIMQRGFRVDETERRSAIALLEKKVEHLDKILQRYAWTVWGKGLNPQSPIQLAQFFYQSMKLPEQHVSVKGVSRVSTNRDSLERLELYFHARPIIACVLAIKDAQKKLSVLRTEIDSDGRMRTSYNIAGTECISGDSLVLTRSGLQRMDRIYDKKDCQVWSGKNFFRPARFVKYENTDGFEIELEHGYILKCSANHPVRTKGGFVAASDLQAWDEIAVQVGNEHLWGHAVLPRWNHDFPSDHKSISCSIPTAMSRDLCEFVGMWLADGSLDCSEGSRYAVRLSNQDWQVQGRFASLVKSLFGLDSTRTAVEVTVNSIELVYWLKFLGFPANKGLGTAKIKEIPHAFMSAKAPMLRAMLRGLTLDSHYTEKGLAYGTQSPILQHQIQQALLAIGIISTRVRCGNGIKLQIPSAYLPRFLAIVGYIQEHKALDAARHLNSVGQWHEPMAPNKFHYISIKEIRKWRGTVYDVTMPKDSEPQYIANGMLVHNTGRLSSSASAFDSGTNLQNLTESLRRIFIADEGWKLCVIDLEQAEARDVGFLCGVLFNDWSYLDNCESGDLHSNNAKLVWPELPWTGDAKADRALADTPFYRDYSYRHMAKMGGHGTNYLGTPFTMARHLKVPTSVMEDFQPRYFHAFPAIPRWHSWTAKEIQTKQVLETPFGRRRHFFGRPNDDATLREAIAFVPQSMTADRTNLGLYRVWEFFGKTVQLLAQTHDSITFQYRAKDEKEIIPQAVKLIEIELKHGSRSFITPGEAKIGFNWGRQHDTNKPISKKNPFNPDGLIKWNKDKPDTRQRLTGLNKVLA